MGPKEVISMKHRYFFPNSMHFYKEPPLFVKGQGTKLTDHEGRIYTDFFGGVTVVNCGHTHPTIVEAMSKQMRTLQHTSIIYLTQPMVELAEKLSSLMPGDINRTFFVNSGTEANEGALLLARLYTGRKGFLAFEGGLHGRSALTMSVTGIPMWRIDPYLDPSVFFADGFMKKGEETCEEASQRALDSVDKILEDHGHEIAACIVEPVQGNGGIHVPAQDFFRKLKEKLEAKGILMIADEIQTGFGRCGTFFAVDHFGVVPDILTMAKALGNGCPIGAFAAREEVALAFNKPSASTLGANPVSMVAGLAVLEVIESQDLVTKSRQRGLMLLNGLKAMRDRIGWDLIKDVRGLGLMVGVQLGSPALVDEVIETMLHEGYIIGKNGMTRDVLAFQPPLIIQEEEIDAMLVVLEKTLRR